MIKFEHVTKIVKDIIVLNDISFNIEDNSILALIGGSQSGKTIITKMIAGLYDCDSGNIDLGYNKYGKENIVALVSENFEENVNMNVYEYLKFYIECYNLKIDDVDSYIDNVLNKYQLKLYKYAEVDVLNINIKKILYLARSLMQEPDILVLDSIMKDTNKDTKDLIRKILVDNMFKRTMVVTCNNLVELGDICSHVAIINSGNLIAYDETDKILDMMDISRQIEIRTLDPNRKVIELLKKDDLVTNIVLDGDRILISYMGDDDNCNLILKKLMDNNIKVYSFKKDIESFAYLNDSISKINNKIMIGEERFE